MCQNGIREIQQKVLSKLDDDMAVYVVWEPFKPCDSPEKAEESSALIPDGRVRQYWAPKRDLAFAFGDTLQIEKPCGDVQPAWDVYMAYGPDARWGKHPPAPAAWMHQLGNQDRKNRLDGDRFRAKVRSLTR